MYVLFIYGLINCHGNPIVKECLLPFRKQNNKKWPISSYFVKYCSRLGMGALNSSPTPNFTQVGPEIKNFKISRILEPETKDDVITLQ